MKTWLLLLLIAPRIYASGFLENFSDTIHLLSQDEVDKSLKNPKNGIPGALLTPLIPTSEIIPTDKCDEIKPDEKSKSRYEVVFVTSISNDPGREEKSLDDSKLKLYKSHLSHLYGPYSEDNFSRLIEGPLPSTSIDLGGTGPITGPVIYRERLPEGLNSKDVLGRAQFAFETLQNHYNAGLIPKRQIQLENGEYKEEEVDFFKGNFNINSQVGRELVIETILQAAVKQIYGVDEYQLAGKMADVIKEIYKTEEERYNAVAAFQARLYRNYNMPRNPGRNNSEYNPDNEPLPKGDLTFNDIIKAAYNDETNMSGVCNDFSEAGAILAEKVFPDKDVLTVNSGSHFGIAIVDSQKTRIIDGEDQHQLKNELYLQPTSAVPSLHISKVFNGKLKEIATVDTQMGQFVTKVFDEDKSLLKVSTNISTVAANFRKITKEKDESITTMSGSIGYGNLATSNVVMVVAKIENEGKNSSSYIGLGTAVQKFNTVSDDTKYHIHLRTGVRRNLINYVSPSAEVKIDTGIQGHFMSALNKDLFELSTNLDFGWALEWINRASFKLKGDKSNGITFYADVENRNGIAPENWGDATGNASKITAESFFKTLGSLRFYLNQINSNIVIEKKITDKILTQATLNYQGSNIGQTISAIGGLDIKAPEGVELYVFVGYQDNTMPGYMTKNSLIVGSKGAIVGGSIKTKKGINLKGAIRGIGSERVSGDLGVEIQLDKPK